MSENQNPHQVIHIQKEASARPRKPIDRPHRTYLRCEKKNPAAFPSGRVEGGNRDETTARDMGESQILESRVLDIAHGCFCQGLCGDRISYAI